MLLQGPYGGVNAAVAGQLFWQPALRPDPQLHGAPEAPGAAPPAGHEAAFAASASFSSSR